MIIGIILGTWWFVLVMYSDVKSDFKRIQTNTINHSRGLLLRITALIPSLLCFTLPYYDESFFFIIMKIFAASGMMASWWWEFFDGWLNKKRGYHWRYNGSNDPNDAKTDNILESLSPRQQMFLKWVLIISFTTFYVSLI